MKVSHDPCVVSERLGVYVSSFVNQDGRSASLTAPNGPSQQLCMRSSMKDGLLGPADVAINESHGTGTALGDPIETGSVKSVFRTRGDTPIPVVASKSNLGHMEGTAGSNGILRTLTSLLIATVPSTVHVRQLNSHIELEGFPGIFPVECLDLGREANVGGLNSFGFGGTNSRAELWASAVHGPRGGNAWYRETDKRKSPAMKIENMGKLDCVAVTCPRCLGPMCWLCGVALPLVPPRGRHLCECIRQEHASYEHCSNCYEGEYKHGAPTVDSIDRGDKVFVTGSWSAWASFEEMAHTGDSVYTAQVVLGDTCREEFHFALERDPQRAIFPVAPHAGAGVRAVGPAKAEAGRHWLIDGRKDGAPTGSVYQVRLEWTDAYRKVSWKPLGKMAQAESPDFRRHRYSVISSLSGFRPVDMKRSLRDAELWEFEGKIRGTGEEMFMFQRDRDSKQLIYPSQHRPADSSVPVLGPDAGLGVGKDMRLWAVKGKPGDVLTLGLRVEDGDITVTAFSEAKGQMSWHNAHGGDRDRYFVKGSWNRWRLEEMEPDMADLDVRRLQFTLPDLGYDQTVQFQIVKNQDDSQTLHPASTKAPPGQALVEGPDDGGRGLFWEVNGLPGHTFQVTLNLGAEDNRKMVTCKSFRRLHGLPN